MSEAALAWRRVSRGTYLIGFGVLLLLTTHDKLGWSFWIEAASLWPVLLVALGIRMIFEKSRAPWAMLLSPLIVLSTLTWLAFSHPSRAIDGWNPVTADAPASVDRWAFTGRLAMASLDLRSQALAPGRLIEGRISGGWATDPRVRLRESEARVEMGGWRGGRIHLLVPGVTQTWELGLSEELPLALFLEGAFTEGDVDLREARLSRIDLQGAFHRLRYHLGQPAQEVRFDIDGAFNDIEIVVPPETPVSVSTDGVVNIVQGRPDRPAPTAPGYRLRVHGFMNHVEVSSDPASPSGNDESQPPAAGTNSDSAPSAP